MGWRLPEPLVEVDERTPEAAAEMAGELSPRGAAVRTERTS